MTTYETGAKTAQSNDLVLTAMNNGASYADRLQVGFAMLQGVTHTDATFRSIVNDTANTMRRTMGGKFKAEHISEAARIVQALTLEHCLETIHWEWNRQTIQCEGRRWWDKVFGNSYFSARIIVPTSGGGRWVTIPFQGGYGNHWEWECVGLLRKMGFFADKPNAVHSELPVHFNDAGYMRKRDMFTGTYL